MGKAKLIAAVTVAAIVAIIFLQNNQPVEFKVLFFDPIQVPKTLLILGSAVMGAVITLLFQFFWRYRKRLGSPAVTPH
ncbi:MAG: lipopolysaccharide assembly protein LapA domain-containing protein [Candidatus Binatia bacterium]